MAAATLCWLLQSTYSSYERPTVVIGASSDWLLEGNPRLSPAVVTLKTLDNDTISLSNGLLARVFAIKPFFATWDIATSSGSALRAISEEATVTLDGKKYAVGGAIPLLADGTACPLPKGVGPVDNCPTAYFNRSTAYGPPLNGAFTYSTHWTSAPTKPFPWKPARHAPAMPWPPLGLRLNVNLTAPVDALPEHRDVVVTLHYEMYQGMPAMSKWMTVTHTGGDEGRDRAAAAAAAPPSLGLPPDQQSSICIEPCDQKLPPSDWESRWLLTPDVAGPIKLSGASAGANLCLTLVQGEAYHAFNNQMDAQTCNESNPLQRWRFDSASGLLLTRASAADIIAATDPKQKRPCATRATPPGVNTTHCGVDVNNHQIDAGTALSVEPIQGTAGSNPLQARWKLAKDASGGKAVQIAATNAAYTDRCFWYTPLPPAPAPAPAPAPKPPCAAPDCVVLTGAVIEILRLNAPWAPRAPQVATETKAVINTSPMPADHGLLWPRATQGHGTIVLWGVDPTFDPQYSGNDGSIQPMLTVGYDVASNTAPYKYGGPGARLRARGSAGLPELNNPFQSFRVMTLYGDSTENERMGLGVRKLTRLLAPQTSETPMFMHLTDTTPNGVKKAVDQIVATGNGFDMIIFSFGSGFNLESTDPVYQAEIKASVQYANAHGVEIGGYDLIALSLTGKGFDAIDPRTHASAGSTCFASEWNRGLLKQVLSFIDATGLSMVETDGPYGGTPCGSPDHDHYGAEDSVQQQWENQVAFYAALRGRGVFIHAPDDYTFAGGANKDCGWYSEMQFSLPRWQHISISHAEVYDYTYFNTPTEKWMFAPLVDYHSGGPAAALEPFSKTGDAWEWTLANFVGAGVGACYRGDQLYDTPAVQAMVTKWMKFWTKYRAILTQDVIHVRRPDMQSVDCMLHVTANSSSTFAALAMLYNPTLTAQTTTLALPLYYSGEESDVELAHEEGPFASVTLARDFSITVSATLKPHGVTYFVVRRKGTR